MSTRHTLTMNVFTMIVISGLVSQLGCCSMTNCGSGCGVGGQTFCDTCPSCGVADASCGCPSCGVADVSCGCPDASCGCPDGCGDGVGCGSQTRKECRLLKRIRNALHGCSGCGGKPYWSEWSDSPPCECDRCDCYGNYLGGPYGSPHGRRARVAQRNLNLAEELQFGEEEAATTYR